MMLPEDNKRIKSVIKLFNKAEREIQNWSEGVLMPMIKECKSLEELEALKQKIAFEICGGDYADYQMPGYIDIRFALAYSIYLD